MSNLRRARESWLADDNPEHFGDAMLLCRMPASGSCSEGKCALDGFCFRGFGSAEVRFCIEKRLDNIEATLRELLELSFAERQRVAIEKINGDVRMIRDNVLQFAQRKSAGGER